MILGEKLKLEAMKEEVEFLVVDDFLQDTATFCANFILNSFG